jgi:succinate dehydrogenase / fumarate reductase flavoprotein subunit
MQREINEGRGVNGQYINLDMRHLGAEKIMTRLPGIRDLSIAFTGVDPVLAPIPVKPGQHYTMGGIDTNDRGETEAKGFYAAGECACVSVHGANRLGGNSLLDTLVYGRLSGQNAADYVSSKAKTRQGAAALEDALQQEKAKHQALCDGTGDEKAAAVRDDLGRLMVDKVGIFRTEEDLKEGWKQVKVLQKRFQKVKAGWGGKKFNQALAWTLELEGNLAMAEVIVVGALARKESRGSHYRTDFTTRNDKDFLVHTIGRWAAAESKVKLAYRPVTLGHFEPKERKY